MAITREFPNNPRGFEGTVSLEVWRTPYDGKRGTADLHIDVVFGEGRIGGTNFDVRFRLRLRRAEVRLFTDSAKVLQFLNDTVVRAPQMMSEKTSVTKMKSAARIKGGLALSPTKAAGHFGAEALAEREQDDRLETTATVGSMRFQHRKIQGGYAFDIYPTNAEPLEGQPWDPAIARVTILDSGQPRKKHEPPEPRVEVRCRREDMIIEDVSFTGKRSGFFERLKPANKLAVTSYIRDQLTQLGVDARNVDLEHPFTEILLADAGPENPGDV